MVEIECHICGNIFSPHQCINTDKYDGEVVCPNCKSMLRVKLGKNRLQKRSVISNKTNQPEGVSIDKLVKLAQEEERKRIARELHDEYGQTLTGLILTLEMVEQTTSPKQAALREKLEKARLLVSRSLDDLRRLTLDLRPTTLDDLGLLPSIRAHIESYLQDAGIRLELLTKGVSDKKRLAPAVEITLFRIIQEASNNIIKHAGAQNVILKLEIKGGNVNLLLKMTVKALMLTLFINPKSGPSHWDCSVFRKELLCWAARSA